MKVGIITFHRAHNCGAALQCVALKTVIERMGHEVRVIDCNDIGDGMRLRLPAKKSVRAWGGAVKNYIFSNLNVHRWRYRLFRWKFMGCLARCREGCIPKDFDRYIVGSDQVFNPDITKEQTKVFLLGDVAEDLKKCSYAASFGLNSLPEMWRPVFASELPKFKYLSVREDSGERICRQELKLEKKAKVVLDPTLLLRCPDYLQFESKAPGIVGKYVLVYWIGGALDVTRALAQQMAARLDARVIIATLIFSTYDSDMMAVSPDQLLWLVRHAEFVFATSFHGTVFSIINHRQFFTVLPSEMKVKGRIVDLLGKLGLEDRVVEEGDANDIDKILSVAQIDYDLVDQKLQTLKAASVDFLRMILS